MNKVIIVGRFTRDPEVRYTANNTCYASFSIAVDRRYKQDGQPTADFPRVIAWGKTAEFIEKYFRKGMKIAIDGRIQTGSYKNNDGQTIYTTDVVAENVEFVESKNSSDNNNNNNTKGTVPSVADDGWMSISDDVDDEELPFN